MIFLEINEFNPELMQKAADLLDARNLKRLLSLQRSETTTDDQAERFGLDPWVQWVSIHTGKSSREHGVGHLGDVPQLQHPQIWESLSQQGLRCGIWGAMNASKGNMSSPCFFLPDPWTFSEQAYPDELNHLLAFPRYYSKNYCDLDRKTAVLKLLRLVWFCLHPRVAAQLLPLAPTFISHVINHGLKEYLLFVLFDLVNASLFSLYYRRTKPDFAILFLNSLAHLQHHKWTDKNGLSEEMRIAFRLFDQALGIIFDTAPFDQPLLVANAFTQFCSYDQNEFLYRQKNPEKFLHTAGIACLKVEQAMTNDGHVFFRSAQEAEAAAEILRDATVNGQPAFHVESGGKTPDKVFYQVIIWEPLDDTATMSINGKSIRFLDQFEQITRRSGSHLQNGHVFSHGISIPAKLYNHEIHDCILAHFSRRITG